MEKVIFKGNKNRIDVFLSNECDFKGLAAAVGEKVRNQAGFFEGSIIKINFCGRDISSEERQELELVFKGNLLPMSEVLFEREHEEQGRAKDGEAAEGISEGKDKFYVGTLRSGQRVKSEGNLIIVGDVNAGAEIIANGNIAVFGTVRGVVHAGYNGDEGAFIVANSLSPVQIRIASVITKPPENDNAKQMPEKAFLKDGEIYIMTLQNSKL